MRVVLIAVSAATLAIVLVVGLGGVEAASFPGGGGSLTNSGVPTVGVRYYRRHPSYFFSRGGDPSYTSVTVTTATRFVNCSACGQKRIGREEHAVLPLSLRFAEFPASPLSGQRDDHRVAPKVANSSNLARFGGRHFLRLALLGFSKKKY